MDAIQIQSTVAAIIADYIGARPSQIVLGARLAEDLGLDTLDMASIANTINVQLGIDLPDETIETAQSVAGLAAAVAHLLAEQGKVGQ